VLLYHALNVFFFNNACKGTKKILKQQEIVFFPLDSYYFWKNV
jgi:hypothetical protein